MRTLLILSLLVVQPAFGHRVPNIKPRRIGWFKSFCERHLIAEDPYQDLEPLWAEYASDPVGHVNRVMEAYRAMGRRAYWRPNEERTRLKALGNELRHLNEELPDERIEEVLTKYQYLE